jgi:tRNA modification GTPase
MPGLLARLDGEVRQRYATAEESPTVVNERQRGAFELSAEALEAALAALRTGASEEFITADLRRAATSLGALTGTISSDEIYREIFSRFCIGK